MSDEPSFSKRFQQSERRLREVLSQNHIPTIQEAEDFLRGQTWVKRKDCYETSDLYQEEKLDAYLPLLTESLAMKKVPSGVGFVLSVDKDAAERWYTQQGLTLTTRARGLIPR